MVETSCGTQGLIFPKILDTELGEFFGGVFDEIPENGFVVVPYKNNFSNTGDLGNSSQAVPDDGMTGDFK